MDGEEFVDLDANVVLQIVDDDRQREDVEQIFSPLLLEEVLHVEEKPIFGGQLLVAADVVDKLFQSMFANEVEVDTV